METGEDASAMGGVDAVAQSESKECSSVEGGGARVEASLK